jgi:antitoxin ParD1/3/4
MMNINLGTQWEEYIAGYVQSGRYLSASEVVREGLRLLQEREEERKLQLERLRHEIDKGVRQLDTGNYHDLDETGLNKHFQGIKKRGRKRLTGKIAANS